MQHGAAVENVEWGQSVCQGTNHLKISLSLPQLPHFFWQFHSPTSWHTLLSVGMYLGSPPMHKFLPFRPASLCLSPLPPPASLPYPSGCEMQHRAAAVHVGWGWSACKEAARPRNSQGHHIKQRQHAPKQSYA